MRDTVFWGAFASWGGFKGTPLDLTRLPGVRLTRKPLPKVNGDASHGTPAVMAFHVRDGKDGSPAAIPGIWIHRDHGRCHEKPADYSPMEVVFALLEAARA